MLSPCPVLRSSTVQYLVRNNSGGDWIGSVAHGRVSASAVQSGPRDASFRDKLPRLKDAGAILMDARFCSFS